MKNALDDIDAAFTAKTGVKVNASYAARRRIPSSTP
jgi:molybdate transport system substrate-binding protein